MRSSAAKAMPIVVGTPLYQINCSFHVRYGSPRLSTMRTVDKTIPAKYNTKPATKSSDPKKINGGKKLGVRCVISISRPASFPDLLNA